MPNYAKGVGALFDAAEEAVAKVFNRSNLIDQAKLAQQYPDIGTPVLNVDKKTGKEFLGKGSSAEEMQLQKLRNVIDKQIIGPGYFDPIFPEGDRYYADPSSYNLQGNTLIDTLPKKAETIAKHTARFDTPESRGALSDAYDRGLSDTSQDWYAMGQLQDAFIKELGPIEGPKQYKARFADAMAATTGGADPGSNMLMATYGNFLKNQGMSPPGASYGMPHPIGGRYVTGNMGMYDKVLNQGQDLTAAGQPKRFNFSANFLGDRSRATIDEQMTQGMAGMNAPPGGTYGIMEGVLGDVAREKGVMPANLQDVAWAGFKGTEGKPMIRWVNEMVERTSRVTGKSPQEVLRGLIRGDMPMYGLGGAAALGALEEEEDPYASGGIY